MRFLGVDYGLKRIGLAIGDDIARVAVPLETIRAEGGMAVGGVVEAVKKEGIEAIVVGMPVQDRPEWSRVQIEATERFIESLRANVMLPIHTEDERFTSAESKRLRVEFGSRVPEDALAAMLILQQYLDNMQ